MKRIMECNKCRNLYFKNEVQGYNCSLGIDIYGRISNNTNHDCSHFEPKSKPKFTQKQKEENRIKTAYGNLGYNNNGDIKTKSDLDLLIADLKESLIFANQKLEEYTEIKDKAVSLISILEDIENEYEKEILRELNPNRTIY